MKAAPAVKMDHDTVPYLWEKVAEKKYNNWVKMTNPDFNTTDFTAQGFPYMLQIEPTSLCNLKCPLCPAGKNELNRPYQHMSHKMFESIIDDMEPYLLFIVLWDWGEPFMNPQLPAMIRYASQRDIKLVTSTNGHFFQDEAYLEAILTSGLSTLIVAIDSLHAKDYEVYRQGGDLPKALAGLARVVELKKRLGSKTLINMRMVLMKQNERELGAMRSMAKSLGVDRFTVKTVNPSCGLKAIDEEIVPHNPRYRRYQYQEGTYERIPVDSVCGRVWLMSNIFSNGDIVPCCYDYNSEMKVGNIEEEAFSVTWNSPAYRELRRKIYCQKNSVDKCRECTTSFKLSRAGWFVESTDFNAPPAARFKNKMLRYLDFPAAHKLIRAVRRR